MRVGLVESMNARPLTWGLEIDPAIEKVYSSPKRLAEMLLAGELDTALISSVECLRNNGSLGYSRSVGVCAHSKVRSILFYENKRTPDKTITVDSGSKSSVALLQVLLRMRNGVNPETEPREPSWIQSRIREGDGSHLLFGDCALLTPRNTRDYTIYDLAQWWNQTTHTSFIFALWAYPKNKPLPDSVFQKSLEQGKERISDIIRSERVKCTDQFRIRDLEKYLTQDLHFLPTESDWKGLGIYEGKLKEFGLF